MKLLCLAAMLLCSGFGVIPNNTVEHVDPKRYAGTWYSLYSIPTMFDKGSRQTNGKYTWNDEGYFDVVTSYKKAESEEWHSVKSKVFQPTGSNSAKMKAQFIWPYKIDYWVIELADDYSYVVVGHPERKLLFIMSRKPSMDKKLYQEIVARCKEKGYDVSKLTCQMQ